METKEIQGITIISLVVTIIIMLILSGVTISSLTSENGIIKKTRLAKQMSETSSEKEAIQLDIALANMENALNTKNKYYIGEPLFDRTLENGDKWNIVIDNETLKQYGTGYNHIAKGTEISSYGKTQYDWIVDYSSGEIIQLSSEYTALSYKSSLAVTDNLVLNIDATNLDNDNWGDVIKHGDVRYIKENEALYFDGDEDYLELSKASNFRNGFTFEIYANLDRLRYDNGSKIPDFSLFCKMPKLNSSYTQAMRFGLTGASTICKFNVESSWKGEGKNLCTTETGDIRTIEYYEYPQNEDVYLTFIYRRYDEKDSQWGEIADRLEYYVNGDLYGYTYYGIDSYKNGCREWDTDNAHFYLGVCPWEADANLYYLKGNVYCTRLYERALSSDEVKENVTKTQMYRQMK